MTTHEFLGIVLASCLAIALTQFAQSLWRAHKQRKDNKRKEQSASLLGPEPVVGRTEAPAGTRGIDQPEPVVGRTGDQRKVVTPKRQRKASPKGSPSFHGFHTETRSFEQQQPEPEAAQSYKTLEHARTSRQRKVK
jgi:hypothetical protein